MQDGIGKLPTPDSHVDGENDAKTMVYNMKRNSKKSGWDKNKEKERFKKYNSKKGKTLNYWSHYKGLAEDVFHIIYA